MRELQVQQQALCIDHHVELMALRVLLIETGLVNEEQWMQRLERIRKRFAGAPETEVQRDLIDKFLQKFDGRSNKGYDPKNHQNRQMPPKKRRSYTPDPVRSRIIARHVSGQSNREIAKEEGIDRDTVSQVLSQDEVVEMMQSYRSRLLEMLPKAITVYQQLLNSKSERVRATAATKLLEGLQVFPKGGVWPEQTVPEQDRDQRKLVLLGQIMEMMLYKGQRYGVPLRLTN